MYDRLINRSEFEVHGIVGVMVGGTKENPKIDTKTKSYPEEKAQRCKYTSPTIKRLRKMSNADDFKCLRKSPRSKICYFVGFY